MKEETITKVLKLTSYQLSVLRDVLEEEIDRNSGAGYDDIDDACRQILKQLNLVIE